MPLGKINMPIIAHKILLVTLLACVVYVYQNRPRDVRTFFPIQGDFFTYRVLLCIDINFISNIFRVVCSCFFSYPCVADTNSDKLSMYRACNI